MDNAPRKTTATGQGRSRLQCQQMRSRVSNPLNSKRQFSLRAIRQARLFDNLCNPTVGGFFRTTPCHNHLTALDSLAQTANVSGGALPGVPMKLIW